MGSLTANRKRHSYIDASPPDSHVSKKLKSSSTIHISSQTLGTSNSTISRLSRYPQTTTKFNREVHAPCRISRFTRLKIGSKGEGFYGYNDVTSSLFIKTQRFVHRSSEVKEVIDVDKVVDERIVVEEDGKEGDSMDYEFVNERIGVEEDGKVGDLMELEPNCCDEGVDKEDDNEVKIMEERSVVTSDVENVEKPVDLLVVDRGIDLLSAEVYKQLLASAERRDVRLKELEFQTQLYERKRSLEQSLRPIKKPEEKLDEETSHAPFIPLTKEEEAEVNRAFSAVNRRKGLVSHKNSCIDITGEILQCLRPGQWLNDEVINLYLELLKEREKREPEKFLRCHFFSTFFYKKLTSGNKNVYDYRAVRRWTTERKLGYFLMDCDKIFVPVHFREMHWCMAIINKKGQKFQYLDSLKARDFKVLKNLAKYYVEEVKDKCKKDIDVSNWEHEFLEDLPQQENGFDCGVFMIKYADFISRGLGLCFGQEHMPYFRLRTAKEILRLRAD